MIQTQLNCDQRASLSDIYKGEVFLLPPSDASLDLAKRVHDLLIETLGAKPREAQFSMSEIEYFEALKPCRHLLYTSKEWHERVSRVVEAEGLNPADFLMDPLRLRVVQHDGHLNPRAKSVYHAHRDTWYGHAQCLLTWWIPLDDLSHDETFHFYPSRFLNPVNNDSEVFDYGIWRSKKGKLRVGWQDRNAGLRETYPRSLEESLPDSIGFECQKGESLIFSGHQFHKTIEQSLNKTRFSLDFRLVHKEDLAAKIGPGNVDNRSKGCAAQDFIPLPF